MAYLSKDFVKGFLLGCLVSTYVCWVVWGITLIDSQTLKGNRKGSYVANLPWKNSQTRSRKVIYETPRLRLEEHSIVMGGKAIDDWLYVEIPSQINILAEYRGKFLVFNQTKYGLKGKTLAPVGGYVEPGETAEAAARRELQEELGLKAGRIYFLGTYRVDVNRGCGFVSSYLAVNCKKADLRESDDLEDQQIIRLSMTDISQMLDRRRFREVKWSNTISLSLSMIKRHKYVFRTTSIEFRQSNQLWH